MSDITQKAQENLPSAQGFNRRFNPRIIIPLIPIVMDSELGQSFGFILDVSRSGVKIQTSRVMEAGSLINIRFTLPQTNTSLSCRVRVAWTRKQGGCRTARCGLLFVDAEAEFLEKIDDYIKEHEADSGVRAVV
jgi:hypothetical protein